jgi:Fe2+ transport system protein FeoA
MLETILSQFTIQVKEKIAAATKELKNTYDFQAVEDTVAELVDALATDLLQASLKEVLEDREILAELKQMGAEQGVKFNGFRTLNVYVYTGRRVTIRSPWFVKKGKKPGRKKNGPNGRGAHLGLDVLGFLSRGSGKFVSWVTKMALLMPSYEIAKDVLQERGVSVSVNTIRRYCRELGRMGLARRGEVSLNGEEDLTGGTLVIEVDGGRLRLRKKNEAGKKRSKHVRAIIPRGKSRNYLPCI